LEITNRIYNLKFQTEKTLRRSDTLWT